ncbi:beta-galactosidase family protein [Lentisphaerota bacterium WC36G]|nr:beta-galactosidase [Lentisphaerae bacterium WC36]
MIKITKGKFLIDNADFKIYSGAIHYFRVVPEYWENRLIKLKEMGLNTIETYMPWNLHELNRGEFNFSGNLDLKKFILTAHELELKVILRPGPYICAEWEFGGLPYWLLKDRSMQIRCMNKNFIDAATPYLIKTYQEIVDLQHDNGGPIIALQIENEYGSFGNDKEYLRYLKNLALDNEITVPLFTSDGTNEDMLRGGSLLEKDDNVWATCNFGSRATEHFSKLKEKQPNKPLMCMEFWNGWFDYWGGKHHTRDSKDVANALEEILQNGDFFNFYMFHGGTNFGFMNGANCRFETGYEPTINSYDYDSPLNEVGNVTNKYFKCQKVIAKYNKDLDLTTPLSPNNKISSYGEIALTKKKTLFSALNMLVPEPIKAKNPLSMEDIDCPYGYILYQTKVWGPRTKVKLSLMDVRDRAEIFVNGKSVAVLYRNDQSTMIEIDIPTKEATLSILVENMGRVNYGYYMPLERKGIDKGVTLDEIFINNWEIFPLPMTNLFDNLKFDNAKDVTENEPAFYYGELDLTNQKINDTFFSMENIGSKGVVLINDHNLSRYWEKGPQVTMYCPAPFLRKGINKIIVFEQHLLKELKIKSVDKIKLSL